MWDSIDKNWDRAVEAIQGIPGLHLERSRQAFDSYWGQQREGLMLNLTDRLKEFKLQNDRLGQFTLSEILAKELQPRACLKGWDQDLARAIDQVRIDQGPREVELDAELRRICRENRPKEELFAIQRKIREHSAATERKVAAVTCDLESMKKGWKNELAFYKECIAWVRVAASKRKQIKLVFTQELKRIEKLQESEFNELFQPTDDSETGLEVQEDLNTAIATALASHSVRTSPADCPFSRGYGDLIENTRLEKSGIIIIIIHLLGLAPAGYLAAPDNGP
jgi:hypothetical protein